MTTLTPSAKSLTGGTNASKPVSSFTTKTIRHTRHPTHPPPPKKNVTLSYLHKMDWRKLTNVWYGSFMGSETLEIYLYTSLTVCFVLFLLLYVPCQQLWSLRDGQFT